MDDNGLLAKRQAQAVVLCFGLFAGFSASCQAQNQNGPEDPYIPKLRVIETNDFIGNTVVAYRFTEEQLARMAQTKLETNRLVMYLERRWPLKRLQEYCVSTNRFPAMMQNLVVENCPVETDLFKGKATGFDRIWVYVSQDNGHATYVGEAGTYWHRWAYSLNIQQDGNHWVIIENLPNDFVDAPKYDLDSSVKK